MKKVKKIKLAISSLHALNKSLITILQEVKAYVFKIFGKFDLKIFLLGRDSVNWSLNKDYNHTLRFLKYWRIYSDKLLGSNFLYFIHYGALLHVEYLLFARLKKLLKIKIITTATNDIRYYEKNLAFLENFVDVWISPSNRIYNFLENRKNKVQLIPFFVDHIIFHEIDKTREEICKDLSIDHKILVHKLIIGSFQRDSLYNRLDKQKWQKDPEFLVNLIEKLKNKNILLLLAGPRRHYIVNECKKRKIPFYYFGNEAYLVNNTDDILVNNHSEEIINKLYNLCDVYIVSSKIEGGPKAIFEASLTKTLIFSTDVGFAKEYIHKDLIFSRKNYDFLINYLENFKSYKEKTEFYLDINYRKVKKEVQEERFRMNYKQLLNKLNDLNCRS